ncbi:zinc finger domain-containing protein [Mycolicibacterium mucogenicum]
MTEHHYRDQTRGRRDWRGDPELVRQHHLALTITCPACEEPPDSPCIRVGEPGRPVLNHLPAHTIRITTATKRGSAAT